MDSLSKSQFQKVPIKITGIGDNTTDRVVEIILDDGGSARIRRDLIEIYGNRAFIPLWLAEKITK